MNNTVFPLRRLPENIQLHIVKSFDYVHLLAFSFISNKSKERVESFNMKATGLWVRDIGELEMHTFFGDEAWVPLYIDKIGLDDSDCVIQVNHQYRWENTGLTFRAIFLRLQSIFKPSTYDFRVERKFETFDTVAIRNLIPQWAGVYFPKASHAYGQRLIDAFLPDVEDVTMGKPSNVQELRVFPQQIGVQNFEALRLYNKYRLTLDDVLVMNSGFIELFKLSVKGTNRLMKLWIKGANPRMEEAFICLNDDLDEERLLKGIQVQVLPGEVVERRVRNMNGNSNDEDDGEEDDDEEIDEEDDEEDDDHDHEGEIGGNENNENDDVFQAVVGVAEEGIRRKIGIRNRNGVLATVEMNSWRRRATISIEVEKR